MDHCLSSSSGSNTSCSAAAASNEDVLVNMDAIDVDVGAHPELGDRLNGAFSLESSRLLKNQTVQELQVCTQAAERYQCNYHAWSHRIWIIKHCLNCSLQVILDLNICSFQQNCCKFTQLILDSLYYPINSIPPIAPAVACMDHYIVYLYHLLSPVHFHFLTVYFLSL